MTEFGIAILTALVGFLVWLIQKTVERRAEERRRLENLYQTLLSTCAEFIGTGNGAPFIIESQRAWLYASDNVLAAINDYLKAFVAYGEAQRRAAEAADEASQRQDAEAVQVAFQAIKEAEAHLRLFIRKELHPRTAIDVQWMKGQWEMATSRPERIREYLERGSPAAKKDDGAAT